LVGNWNPTCGKFETLSITHRIKLGFFFKKGGKLLKKFGKIFNFPELRARPSKAFFVFFQKQASFWERTRPKFGKIENFPELFKKKP
jgi:hypothetical protein